MRGNLKLANRALLLVVHLVVTLSSAGAAKESAVTVSCSLADGAESTPATVEGKVILESLGGGTAVETSFVSLGSKRIEVPSGLYRLRVEASPFWAEELIVGAGEDAEVTLYPTGELEARMVSPPGAELPQRLAARFRRTGATGSESSLSGEVDCPLETEGSFTCTLPALSLDVELRAAGFVPVYLWDEQVLATTSRVLGKIQLRTGTSVAGWVIDEGADRGVREEVEIHITTQTGETPAVPLPAATAERLSLSQRRIRPGDNGFFQLHGVAPGPYRIVARGPDGAVSEGAEIEVVARRETRLAHPLLLRPPARLEVVVDPPVAPSGEPWMLTLTAVDDRSKTRREFADWGGVWVADKIEPGSYRLIVEVDGRTPAHGQRWWLDTIEVTAPSTLMPISLSWIEVEGELRDQEGPVTGALFFGGRHGLPRITFETDDEGRFSGALTREGTWKIDFASDAEDRRVVRLDDVDVEVGPSGKALLDLEVSGLRLSGRVVTAGGEPAPGAIVRILSSERRSVEAEMTTDGEGFFELAHLRRGEIWISAEGSTGRAAPMRVELTKASPEPLELVLRSDRELSGRVTSAGYALSGALVRAVPVLPEGAPFSVERLLTDPGGSFRFSVPNESEAVYLVIAGAGRATTWRRIVLAAAPAEIEVDVPVTGGRLIATFDELPGAVLVGEEGEIGLHLLADRTSREDGLRRFEIDRLAAGSYRLCPAEPPATIRYDRCREVRMTAGGDHLLHFEASH